jgi:hypothetical protein
MLTKMMYFPYFKDAMHLKWGPESER